MPASPSTAVMDPPTQARKEGSVRRVSAILALCGLLAIAAPGGAAIAAGRAATRLTIVQQPFPAQANAPVDGVCPFPVTATDRGGLTLTTAYDARGGIRWQELTGDTVIEFTHGVTKTTIPIEADVHSSFVPGPRGIWTEIQRGSWFVAMDDGRHTGKPSLTWFQGVVISRGVLDPKTLQMEVVSQTRIGHGDDICEMLTTGLKPRH